MIVCFAHTNVTSQDITALKKRELVDLVLAMVAAADVTVETHSYHVEEEDQRRILILSGDDVFDYVEEAVEQAARMRRDEYDATRVF